jgi:hypothetical protein
MEDNNNNDNNIKFIKADDNKIINEKCIKWIKKMDECLMICTRSTGCFATASGGTHTICKLNNPTSYETLNKFFK